MPVAQSTEAGRAVASNLHARKQQAAIDAKRAADELNEPGRYEPADTTTPLKVGRAPLEQLPEPPAQVAPKAEKAARRITVQTTVEHRGRSFTISAEGMTLDQFCDLLDERGYAAQAQTQEWQTLPDGTPICPKHHTPMRKRERQGDTWYSHSAGKGSDGKDIYCKGYHGKDSPGSEVD